MRFQPDTGAQCNVIPVELYKKATKDHNLERVEPIRTPLVAYGGTRLNVVGHVELLVERNNTKYKIACKLVDEDSRPLLGRKACIGMNIVKYIDNDEIAKPQMPSSAQVFTADAPAEPLSRDALLTKYPTVFAEKTGEMPGFYHIRIDEAAIPVQDAPRRVPVALREPVKRKLEELHQQEIIEPVTTPTPWINSMVEVVKNGKLRICLDPRQLNKAIQREHYPLPTIEDVATRLHGAKVFTKLDVRNGFWHVKLDEESSYLTTFNTPFGRYRWKRMPFGISSAPEVFQRKMNELVSDLKGIEVIADDFVVVGYGETHEEAVADHDRNLNAFLQRCEERGVALNAQKLCLRESEVPFIGHITTSKGLCIDPAKVKAIQKMPAPTDKAGVQRVLGMVQYLSKFLPNLADITKPLRDLTQKDVPWTWGPAQESAFEQMQAAVSSTPVLRYYNLAEEVTLQCDASQHGLGAALLQNGQPVAYASRALTSAETRYAQIEKELLAIVFACERFEAYIYGRDETNVQTDHKPLESIFKKPLNSTPKRLQRMMLRLQKYQLTVKYHRGETLKLADTLSRAFLPEVNTTDFTEELASIDHRATLPVSEACWMQVNKESADDAVMSELRTVILNGWPETRAEVPESLKPYFDVRDELTVQGNIVFKGQRLVVPRSMRNELMEVVHSSHIGIEGCLRRARDSIYWPRMNEQLKDKISKCDVCLAHRPSQPKEPLQQHDFIARPWSKVGADLCVIDSRELLVVCDYYSNYIEVSRLTRATSSSVIRVLKEIFARYGVPDTLVTDNGTQFASAEFAVFARTWSFDHVTSSPRYPQSNGKAENAVKTVKQLFTKCRQSGQSEFQALLDWRNTPTEGMQTSPAQRLMGRRCKTLLPIAGQLLQPRYSTEQDAQDVLGRKERQAFFYNKKTKPLEPIAPGETIRLRLPGQQTWSAGTCLRTSGPRSYKVEVDGVVYRRNRRQLIRTSEPEPSAPATLEPEPESNLEKAPTVPVPVSQQAAEPTPQAEAMKLPVEAPRRSERVRKQPAWLKDYSTCN